MKVEFYTTKLGALIKPTEISIVHGTTGHIAGLNCLDTEGTRHFLTLRDLYVIERDVPRSELGSYEGCLGGCNYGGLVGGAEVDRIYVCEVCKLAWIEENLNA